MKFAENIGDGVAGDRPRMGRANEVGWAADALQASIWHALKLFVIEIVIMLVMLHTWCSIGRTDASSPHHSLASFAICAPTCMHSACVQHGEAAGMVDRTAQR